jgi:hypothetical protein
MTIPQLQEELKRVREEMENMPMSHSQSNPSYVLGLRSLKRRQERILEALAALRLAETKD